MSDRMYVIVLNCGDRLPPNEQIQQALAEAKDWLKFSSGIFFIRTGMSPDYWYGRLRTLLKPEDNIVISELVPGMMSGWTSQLALQWFASPTPTFPDGM